jgi:hypothetical protein
MLRTRLFTSVLLWVQNLAYAIMCDAWLCTSSSNWCLLIYEGRSLWERKGNRMYEECDRWHVAY